MRAQGEPKSSDHDPHCPSPTAGKKYSGKFQKASVDEAFLEPGRRILEAELTRSEQEKNLKRFSSAALANPVTGLKRSRSGCVENSEDFRSCPAHVNSDSGENAEDEGCDESETTGRRGGTHRAAQSLASWSRGTSRRQAGHSQGGDADARRVEVDRLLEAGGFLGIRIQRMLRESLEYDCSVGVAENKFLAKLATSTVKPKGVRVLFRRDVTSVLASTASTKIPGCGRGTPAARQFAEWGAVSVLDLRRLAMNQLCERLGEHLGKKVYDRCRGIDNDPVEPNPEPSRVSSSMSFVPLIKPAECLGRPKEKLTPVFPWELAPLRACIVTLVDDLLDRMKEASERDRRPTRLCVEYHLHKRGSKSQTFCLPPSKPQPRKIPTGEALGEVLADGSSDPELAGHLPPAPALVELSLLPFKRYRRDAPQNEEGQVEGDHGRKSPPVVKLIITLLGFESLEKGKLLGSSQGQRTLLDMVRPGQNTSPAKTAAREKVPDHVDTETFTTSSAGASKIVVSGSVASAGGGGARVDECAVHNPPEEGSAESSVGVSRSLHESRGERAVLAPPGDTLVRCPICKACFRLGHEWDDHREEHSMLDRKREGGREFVPRGTSMPIPVAPRSRLPEARNQRWAPPSDSCDVREAEGVFPTGFVGGERSVATESQHRRAWKRRTTPSCEALSRLSSLLHSSVDTAQVKGFLEMRGFLQANEQTRFADVFVESAAPGPQK